MNLNKINICVIDDDIILCAKIKHWLEFTNSNITIYHSAEDAIDFISNSQPEIIILDNYLPDLKGREILELYKVFSPTSIIIMISSNFSLNEVAKSIQGKVDYFILKNDLTKESLFNIIEKGIIEKSKQESLWGKFMNFKDNLVKPKNDIVAILEDDEIFLRQIKHTITKLNSELVVHDFTETADFINFCKEYSPSYIFLDYNLKTSNGEEVLILIKSKLPKTTVVIISSQEKAKVAMKLHDIGVYSYIVKDYEWKDNVEKTLLNLNLAH